MAVLIITGCNDTSFYETGIERVTRPCRKPFHSRNSGAQGDIANLLYIMSLVVIGLNFATSHRDITRPVTVE